MSFTQDLFSSRRNYTDGSTRVGDQDRIWYDSNTNVFRIGDGTPGGKVIGAAGNVAILDNVNAIHFNTAGLPADPAPGTIYWNPAEDCLNITQNDGSILQVGLENYIEVRNTTGNTLINGDVVRFGGVSPAGDIPEAVLMTADNDTSPLYIIGVITNETISNNSVGRATILGKVHGLDTTGSAVGETWGLGDLLWVNPTMPGKLTKVKPTVPDIAVSVAAVVEVNSTHGTLLVRPTIWPRLLYGTFSSNVQQTHSTINTANVITLNGTTIASGFSRPNTSQILAAESGLYNFSVSIQLTSTNSSAKNVYFWPSKNGVAVPYSTRATTVTGNGTQFTFVCNWTISMAAGQYVEINWAVDNTTIRLDNPVATSFAPATPSVLVTVTQVAL